MKKTTKRIICVATTALSLGSFAEDISSGQITAKVSTMGLGLEYTHPINSALSVGFGINKFNRSEALIESGINYESEVDFKSLSVIANYHPWENGFRLRGGAYYNKNEVNLKANYLATAADTIGDASFTGATVNIDGSLGFKKIAPYVGIGYGSEPFGDNNLSFDLDIGVMYSPVSASLKGSCTGIATCADGTFDSELAKEQKELTDSTDGFDLYPVVSLGLSYRF